MRHRLKWTLFVLCLLAVGWAVHAWWPLSPRCTIRGQLVVSAVSPEGQTLTTLTFGEGSPLQAWDTFSGRELASYLQGARGLHNGSGHSRDRRFFAAFDEDDLRWRGQPPTGKLALVDLVAGREWRGIVDTDNAQDIPMFSPKGTFLVVVGSHDVNNKKLHLVEARSGKLVATLPAVGNGICHGFSADEKLFAFFAKTPEGVVFTLWDTESRQVRRLEGLLDPRAGALTPGSPSACPLSPDGRTFVASSDVVLEGVAQRTTVLWDLPTGQYRPLLPKRRYVHEQLFSPDSRTLATWVDRDDVELWDVASGQRRAALKADPSFMVFSSDGRLLIVSSAKGDSWTFWDAGTGQKLWQRTGPFPPENFSPDFRFLVDDKTAAGRIDVLDTATGNTRLSIPLGEGLDFSKPVPPAQALQWVLSPHAFTPDGRLLAITRPVPAREPGFLRRWLGNWWPFRSWAVNAVVVVVELDSGRELFRLDTHDVRHLHIADDGRTLVTTHDEGNDPVISCWDVPCGPPLRWVVGLPLMMGTIVVLFSWWRNRRKANVGAGLA